MLTFTDYALENVPGLREYLKKNKKKQEAEEALKALEAPIAGSTYLQGGSVVPTSGTSSYAAAADTDIAPVASPNTSAFSGYFKKGALEDGWQTGDISRMVLGSATDFGKNFLQGAAGIAETTVDAFAGMAPIMMEQQLAAEGSLYSEGERKLYLEALEKAQEESNAFVTQDLLDEEAAAKKILAQAYAGMNVWNAKDRYQQAMDYMTDEVVDSEIVAPSRMEQNSVFDQKADALVQSGGQMTAQLLLNSAVPWWTVAGASAFGSEYEAALKEGASNEDAVLSGLITAGAEVLTEQLGGIKFPGAKTGLDEGLTKLISRTISDRFLRTAAKAGVDMAAEGLEEYITEWVGQFGQWLSYKNEGELMAFLRSEEAVQARIDAIVGGALMGGAFAGANTVGAAAQGRDYASGMTNNERAVVDKVYRDALAEAAANTKDGNLTEKQKARIYDSVLQQLERGDLSTDTIREVLGGEGYKQYQKSEAEWKALEQEYDQLYNMKNGEKSSKQVAREEFLKEKLESQEAKTKREENTKKYTQGIQDMALKDRLGESYRQQGQRGVAFEADVSQYSGKAQETVQRAVEAGILNNTRKTHDFVDLIAKIADHTGQVFNFTDNQRLKESGFAIEGKQVNGYVSADGITLNINSPKALNRVAGHEVMHVLQEAGLADALTQKLFDYAESKGELASRREAVEALYKGMDANINEELAAELVGDYLFSNEDFVRQLHREDLTVFEKVWDEIKRMAKMATTGSKEERELAKIEKMFADVYRDAKGAKNTAREGSVRYSLSGTTSPSYQELVEKKPIKIVDVKSGIASGSYADMKDAATKRARDEGWLNKPHHNADTDSLIFLTEKSFTHAYSNLRSSFGEDTIRCMAHIPEIIENAVLIHVSDPKDSRKAEKKVYTFLGAVDGIGGIEPVKLTVKAFDVSSLTAVPENIRAYFEANGIMPEYSRLYDTEALEVIEIEGIKKESDASGKVGGNKPRARATSDSKISIADLIDLVNGDAQKYIPQKENSYSISSADKLAPVAKDGEVYGWDIGIDAPVREDLDTYNVPEMNTGDVSTMDIDQIQARISELTAQRDELGDRLNEMADRGAFGAEYDRLGNEWGELNRQVQELESQLPTATISESPEIKLTKKATADIVREVRSTLGLTNQQIADCREIIEAYRTGEIQDKEALVEALQTQFGLYTETHRDQQLEEVKRAIRTRGIKVPEAVKQAIPDYADIRRKNFGKVRLTESGLGINEVYHELESLYPGYFNENRVSNPEDQLLQMIKLANTDHITQDQRVKDAADVEKAADAIVKAVNIAKWDQEQKAAYRALSDQEKALARIDRYLTQDKMFLDEEFEPRRREFASKEGWISRKARELAQELKSLEKGVKASAELGRLLDKEKDWSNLRSALTNVQHTPGRTVNENSFAEATVRELLNEMYEDGRDALENEYNERLSKMDAEADEKRKAVEIAQQRKVKHAEHAEFVKNLIGDTTHWVDKPLGIQYATNTLQRNLRDIVRGPDGKPDLARAQALYEAFGGEYNHHEAQLKQEDNAIKKWYLDQKITKEESVYIQMLGEFLHNPDTTVTPDMVEAYAKEHKDKIDQEKVYAVIDRARADYDALFERLNKVLRENGMKEIPYRKGYFPHMKMEGEENLLAKVLRWKTKNGDQIPTSIAGMTEQFEPTRSYQSFNKQRQGDATEYDFRKGFDAYVHGALDWIYHIEDIQKRREFENYIRYIHSEEGIKEKIDKVLANDYLNADEVQDQIDHILKEANNPLGNFITDFRTQTNLLAAKKHSLDRSMEQMINRDVYSVASQISGRVSANMVAGSLSAAMSNVIPITQSWGEVSPLYTLRALGDIIKGTVHGDDAMVEKSDFLTNRLVEEEKLSQDFWDKAGDKIGWLMGAVDSVVSKTVWDSKYRQNLSQGMSENAAIRDADQFAENLMAGRSRGNQPTLFESKNLVTKMFTAFQLEVNNQYQYMFKDLPRAMQNEAKGKLVWAYAKIFVGAYLYNALSTAVTGREQAFDPIRILQRLLEGVGDEEEDDSEDIVTFAEDILENTPFIGGLMGGGRVPISSALPYDGNVMDAVSGVAKAAETGDWKDVLKELENPMYYLLPPMAGGQIRKTVQGLGMFIGDKPTAGSYTDDGALRYTVDANFGNVFQAALFGQWANKNAQQYIEEGRKPLSEKQTEEFLALDIPITQYWEIRDGLKDLKTLNEKADYIASLDLSTKQKNILINNLSDRKERIDLEDYDQYADFAEMDFAVKKPELYSFLQEQGVTVKEYEKYTATTKEAYSWAAQNPEKYTLSRAVTDNLVQYRRYTQTINGIEADKDADGKVISGSRKDKVVEYINKLDLDYGARIILYRMTYTSDDTYNYEIVEYLNSRKDISYQEMVTILEELDMEVDKDGNVTW